MKRPLYWAAAALVSGLTVASAASAGPLPQTQSNGLVQELSARCRVVVTYRWRYGRRIAVRRTVCTRPHCRTIVRYHWHHGRRVAVRSRVC